MTLPCEKPRVSINRERGRVLVRKDEQGDKVDLMLQRNGIWTTHYPTADELMEDFEPVYDVNEAQMLVQPAINLLSAVKKLEVVRGGF